MADDSVTIPADRLADLERIERAAGDWLRAWVSAQSISSVTDGKTAAAFESSKRLAAAVGSTMTPATARA